MENIESVTSPLIGMDCSFENYLTRRKMIDAHRMDGHGIPNYAFAMDYECRKKLDSIPRFYDTAKTITSTYLTRTVHEYTRSSMAVGPTQFPEIYQISCDCARTLGIGIPNVFIKNDPIMNAGAYAMDDIEPMVVVNSGLLERMNPGELKYIIGHECGHIQNYHSAYEYLSQLVLNAGLNVAFGISQMIASLMTVGSSALLAAWSRAAETTADRAGMLCADRPEDCYSALAKIMYGGTIGSEHEIDYDAIRAQLEHTVSSVAKYSEILDSHPATVRRIAALQEFCECEAYYEWRPDQKKPGQLMRTKAETDERCRRYIDLSKNG
ncbi:MAG: M48 family metallopeptidase [Lachnospiraceae bacterium]|nr:M48 family metallopeptidase [Lachnospiraceae bacterium]